METWEERQLASLRQTYAGMFDIWTVRTLYPRPDYVWCAKRVGTETACVNAGTPEELIKLLGEMACQCPRHSHRPDDTSSV